MDREVWANSADPHQNAPVKIISLILSCQSLNEAKTDDPREKTPDHPQKELGLPHITQARLKPIGVRWRAI